MKCRIVNAKVATTGIGLSTVMIVCSNQSYFEKAKAWCHAGMLVARTTNLKISSESMIDPGSCCVKLF